MEFLDEVIKRARDYDASRPRSLQTAVGWSEVGGCRAALGYRLDGAWATDETDTWAAQRGTAFHEYLEPIIAGLGVRTEVDTIYRGIPGHADLVGPDWIGDIKTKTLANAKTWQNDPSTMRQARVQAHGYAAGLVDAGELPPDCTVRLLIIPVDGTFADWWCYEEPFDRTLADEGADRLDEVRALMAAGEPLPKDKPYFFCESYCPFFSLCRDPATERGANEVITDPELVSAVARYGEINAITGPLDREKKALTPGIRGLRGQAGDWRISLGKPGEDKPVLDEETVRADYEERGLPVPEVIKPGNAPRLNVTRIRKEAA
jgi:hypothetical protein